MKRIVVIVLAASVLALGAARWLSAPEAGSASVPSVDAGSPQAEPNDDASSGPEVPGRAEIAARAPAGFHETRPEVLAPSAERVGETTVSFPSEPFRPEAYDKARMAIFGEFWREAEASWDAARFENAQQDDEMLDGRQSYQAYVYLRTCLDAPRTDGQMDRFLERLDRASTNDASERQLRRIQQVLDRVEAGAVRCGGLPDVLEPLTIDWLTRAATRGYPLAQIAFYRSYRWLAARRPHLVFGEHDRIATYRRLAPALLEAALQSGHPEAFTEMGQALADGIVFEVDEDEAYAYAIAASLADHGQTGAGGELRAKLEAGLDMEQRRAARERARELCDRYCL